MSTHYVPRKCFLTRGVGVHREKLVSFEMALRDARIASFNLVTVSSILPPHCAVVAVGMAVRTGIRAGKETNAFEAAFFKLLDVLQKPTAWVYNRIIPPERRQPPVLEPQP
jgi:hypothetical protein